MEENDSKFDRKHEFWHFLRYNPPSLFSYWLQHMRNPSDEFWTMMAWNSPYFENWLKEGAEED